MRRVVGKGEHFIALQHSKRNSVCQLLSTFCLSVFFFFLFFSPLCVCVRACVRACVRVCVCCHGKGYLEHLNVLQVQGVFWPRRDDVSRAAAGQTRVLESGTR